MHKLLSLIGCVLAQHSSPAHTVASVSLTTELSSRTNFTLASHSAQQKVVLEVWTERMPSTVNSTSDPHSDYKLNGKIYINEQDLFALAPQVGMLAYKIDIGIHEVVSEVQFYSYPSGTVGLKANRDWMTLYFSLNS